MSHREQEAAQARLRAEGAGADRLQTRMTQLLRQKLHRPSQPTDFTRGVPGLVAPHLSYLETNEVPIPRARPMKLDPKVTGKQVDPYFNL